MKKLFDNSIYKDVPKLPLSKKSPSTIDNKTAAVSEKKDEKEPFDDEPPAPNFINLDLLVKPNK